MTLAEVVARARRSIGHGCKYVLGKGGMDPRSPHPWDSELQCDCSGFAMWCCDLSRQFGDGWLNTDSILKDGKTPGGLFEQVPMDEAVPGYLLVYGRGTGAYGHIGVISAIGDGGAEKAIHCSSGNWKKLKDAIAETGIGVWRIRPDSIVVRCLSVEEAA